MIHQTFTINGMTCDACTKLTAKRIRSIEGVHEISVDLQSKRATIEADRPLNVDEINAAFGESNYRAEDNSL